MSYARHAFLTCDKCGLRIEVDPRNDDPLSPIAISDDACKGWFTPDRKHHLCPECTAVYKKREAEMRRELKELAGIETVEIDL